jgi:hypothetical protein
VNANIAQVHLARQRRDLFKDAFAGEPDVKEVFGSGSLARSTQLKPVHDVDLIVVYDPAEHPEWGQPGPSAEEALRHVQAQVTDLLGSSGTLSRLVRETRVAGRDRAVKCFIDPPEADDAFTVDVMPALRQATNELLLPSVRTDSWNPANPEYLIRDVARLQRAWKHFRPMVRVLKDWRLDQPFKVKSLVMEVLALTCLPTSGHRADALRAFFTAAAVEVNYGVDDPANYCGAIQPDLDHSALSSALSVARDHATAACAAEADGDTDEAAYQWQEVFGIDFPAQPKPKPSPAIITTPVWPRPVKDAPQG